MGLRRCSKLRNVNDGEMKKRVLCQLKRELRGYFLIRWHQV